jgi:flagellar hook-associated protein 3 FlgL
MNVSGFPSILQFTRLSTAIADLKERSEVLRVELVTGRDPALKSAGDATSGDLHLLRKAFDDVSFFRGATARALGRAGSAQAVLQRAAEGANGIGATMLDAIGRADEATIETTAIAAKAELGALMSSFNQRFEGRALFSGDAADSASLADAQTLIADISALYSGAATPAQFQTDLDTYFNDPAGGFATNIYLGGAGNAARVEISDGELIDYSAKADEQPVKDLLRGLATIVVAAAAAPSIDRDATLNTSAIGVVESEARLTLISARIGVVEERMQTALASLDAESAALASVFNERTTRDPFEAALELQQLESQLQSSFTLTARISRLSLVNFLR